MLNRDSWASDKKDLGFILRYYSIFGFETEVVVVLAAVVIRWYSEMLNVFIRIRNIQNVENEIES